MWAWLGVPPKVVHAVSEMRVSAMCFEVLTPCGLRDTVYSVFPGRPGQSFDLCPKCEPMVSTRKEDA